MKKKKAEKTKEKRPRLIGKNKEKFDKLVSLIEDVGDWNIDYLKLAKELDVPKSNIYWWREKILRELPPINPAEMGKTIIGALRSSIRQAQMKIRTAQTDKDKRGYMNTLAKLSESMTDMMEKYALKEKVADKFVTDSEVNIRFEDFVEEE